MAAKVLYCVGLHGDQRLFREVILAAETENASHLIFGGDTFPNVAAPDHSIAETQADFLEAVVKPFLEDLRLRSRAIVIFHPGNNDYRFPTVSRLKAWAKTQRGRVAVADDGSFKNLLPVPIVAYPYVPPTPCEVKDWEKWDDAETGNRIPETFVHGVMSEELRGTTPVLLSPSHAGDTIQGDLEARALSLPANAPFVLLAFGPPFETPLDLLSPGEHIGSRALRQFIEKTKPVVSLHGHAHQSPRVNGGAFATRLGPTLCINPGQAKAALNQGAYYVTFDFANPAGTLKHSVLGQYRP